MTNYLNNAMEAKNNHYYGLLRVTEESAFPQPAMEFLNKASEVDLSKVGNTTIEFYADNLVTDMPSEAVRIIEKHEEAERLNVASELESVAHERAFLSKTYKVNVTPVDGYVLFMLELFHEIRNNGCKKVPFITFGEFRAGTTERGQKVGRYLHRCGIRNEFVSTLHVYEEMNVEEELFFTISGATQHIIGMSHYVVDADSCQGWEEHGLNYPLYSFGAAMSKEIFVAFLHENEEDLDEEWDEFMLSRTTVVHAELEGVDTFHHANRVYTKRHRELHRQIIGLLDGHFDTGNNYSGNIRVEIEGGAYRYYEFGEQEIEDTYVVDRYGNEIDTDHYFYASCNLCDGDGSLTLYARNSHGQDIGSTSITCTACSGTGEIEVEYDLDGEISDSIEDIELENETFSQYVVYPDGFENTREAVIVPVNLQALHHYLKEQTGRRLVLGQRKNVVEKVVGSLHYLSDYSALLDEADRRQTVEGFTEIELIEKYTLIYGIMASKELGLI